MKRLSSIGAAAAAVAYLAAAFWALLTDEIRAFIAGLPWSYFVASGPWEGSTVVALFIPGIVANAVLIYVGIKLFLRFTAASLCNGMKVRGDT